MVSQPQIIYNGNTETMVSYLTKPSRFALSDGDLSIEVSNSGKTQIWGTQRYINRGDITIPRIYTANRNSLVPMFSWIRQGRQFAFLDDSSKTKIDTTIYGQINSTTLEVNDATGIVAGQNLYLRTAGWLEEIPIVASTTGSTFVWTSRTSGTVQALNAVAYGNGVYVVVGAQDGATCYVASSTNGATWTRRTIEATTTLLGITYANNLFVAIGFNDQIYTSPDGITWTQRTFAGAVGDSWYGVVWSGTQFVAVGSGARVLTSSDGTTWTLTSVAGVSSAYAVSYSSSLNLFVLVRIAASNQIYTSPDGITWTLRTSGTVNALYSITWSGTQFVAVGNGGTILTSPDGIAWTTRTAPSTNALLGICWTGSQFIAVSNAGTYATSTDGVTWAQTILSGAHNAISSANNLLLIVGNAGEIYTSTRPHQVTFTTALKNTYTLADTCRMDGYYPVCTIVPKTYKEDRETGIGWYSVSMSFQEVV